MKYTLRTAVAAVAIAATALGFAGTAAAAPATNLCDTVDANGMCQFHASGPFDDIDMVFPAHYPDQQAVTDYLSGVLNDYTTATDSPDLPTAPQALDVTSTQFSTPNSQTLVLDIYQNISGSAHPMEWYKAFNYNTTTHAPVTFDSVFKPGSVQKLLPLVQHGLGQEFGQPVTIPTDTGLDAANYQDFALTNDSVIFFFGKNQLLPASSAASVSLPRNTIKDLLI